MPVGSMCYDAQWEEGWWWCRWCRCWGWCWCWWEVQHNHSPRSLSSWARQPRLQATSLLSRARWDDCTHETRVRNAFSDLRFRVNTRPASQILLGWTCLRRQDLLWRTQFGPQKGKNHNENTSPFRSTLIGLGVEGCRLQRRGFGRARGWRRQIRSRSLIIPKSNRPRLNSREESEVDVFLVSIIVPGTITWALATRASGRATAARSN